MIPIQLSPDQRAPDQSACDRSTPAPNAPDSIESRLGVRGRARCGVRAACFGLWLVACAMLPIETFAQCLPDPAVNDDVVTCSGTSTGYEAPTGVDGLTLTLEAGADFDDSDPGLDAAIRVNDGNEVVIEGSTFDENMMLLEPAATITVTETGGFGIAGGLNNEISVFGTIDVMADDGRGISVLGIGDADSISNIGTAASGVINVFGDNGVAIESIGDSLISNFGTLNLEGADNVGILVGDRVFFDAINPVPGFTMEVGNFVRSIGIINVGDGTLATSGSIGIQAGDGWFPNDVLNGTMDPDFTSVTNGIITITPGSEINLNSIGGYGIRVGDDANVAGNNNSSVLVGGLIDVMAEDAIGVSLGGNDLDPTLEIKPYSLFNLGTIGGSTALHGALIEFRTFSTGENYVLNGNDGNILGDLTLQGVAGRAIVIQGTAGVERVENDGRIRGDILLGDNDDFFMQGGSGSYEGNLDGGAGFDTLMLKDTSASAATFDVSQLIGFERVRIGGLNGWSLSDADLYTGLTQIDPDGRLVVDDPLVLGGDFAMDSTSDLVLRLDESTPALTINGDAAFAGNLIVDNDPDLPSDPNNPYLLIDVGGTRNSSEFGSITFLNQSSLFTFTPIFMGDDLFVRFAASTFEGFARTPNQLAVARHLSEIQADGGAEGELAELLTNLASVNGSPYRTFDALSPEAYDAQTTVVVEAGRQITRLLLDRPRECRPGETDPWSGVTTPLPCHARRIAPWVATTGTFRRRDKFVGHPRYDARIGGLVVGLDARPLAGLDLTFAIGSQRGSVDVANARTSTLTMTDVSGHAGYSHGPFRVQTALSWGHGFHRDRRVVEFPDEIGNPVSARAEEEHDSDRVSLAAEASVQFETGPVVIEPILNVDWAWLYQRPISESSAGRLGLRVDRRDDEVGSVSAGLRASTVYHQTSYIAEQLEWMDGVWRPQLDVRWREIVEGAEREIDARLVGAPSGVSDFTIEGQEDDGGFEIGAALSFIPQDANRLQLDLRYQAFVASHTLEQDLTFRVQLGF